MAIFKQLFFTLLTASLISSAHADTADTQQANPLSAEERTSVVRLVQEATYKNPEEHVEALSLLKEAQSKPSHELSDEYLEKLISKVLKSNDSANDEVSVQLQQARDVIIANLKQFKVTGAGFCIDPNVGFIVDNIDPEFSMTYKNGLGESKTRNFKASIDSIGLKLECGFRFCLVFFVGTAPDFYEAGKQIELGYGIESSLYWLTRPLNWLLGTDKFLGVIPPFIVDTVKDPLMAQLLYVSLKDTLGTFFVLDEDKYLGYTGSPQYHLMNAFGLVYAPFKNTSGGMLILNFNLGLGNNGFCLVHGGTLTPVEA